MPIWLLLTARSLTIKVSCSTSAPATSAFETPATLAARSPTDQMRTLRVPRHLFKRSWLPRAFAVLSTQPSRVLLVAARTAPLQLAPLALVALQTLVPVAVVVVVVKAVVDRPRNLVEPCRRGLAGRHAQYEPFSDSWF